jgi:hypothetical protein
MSKIEILDVNGNPLVSAKNNIELARKSQKMVLDLVRQTHSVYRQEIDNWQMARQERLNTESPFTYRLQDLYKDVMIDSHLTAMVESRILRVVNKNFVLKDKKGVADPERSEFLHKRWFTDALRYSMESIFYEYSLLFFEKTPEGKIARVKKVPREHVNPETGLVVKSVYDTTGLPFNEFPFDLLFAKLYDGYGLLEKAAPLTVLKRHSWASWDEFEQIFGMPIRIAKLGTLSDDVKNEVASWLKTMGTASYGVGSSDGSSRSQAEVHERTQDEITEADIKNVLNWINDQLVPLLRHCGYDIKEDEHIGVELVTDPAERMKIDEKVMMHSGYKLSKEYLEKTYGVELEDAPEPPAPIPGKEDPKPDEKKK